MDSNHDAVAQPALVELLNPDGDLIGGDLTSRAVSNFTSDLEPRSLASADRGVRTIGLIDGYQFSQECLKKAFETIDAHFIVSAFTSVPECIAHGPRDFDVVVFYSHATSTSEMTIAPDIAAIREALPDTPLVVFSDAEDAQHPKTIRNALKVGAHGFVPTRTTGIPMAIAAIRFVIAGGTFAPLDMLLSSRAERAPEIADTARGSGLTSRQMAVLSHLQQGKANKIIAYELSVSESTVKVHVRNIMRKMGATNRTQAAYKAQKLWDGSDLGCRP